MTGLRIVQRPMYTRQYSMCSSLSALWSGGQGVGNEDEGGPDEMQGIRTPLNDMPMTHSSLGHVIYLTFQLI